MGRGATVLLLLLHTAALAAAIRRPKGDAELLPGWHSERGPQPPASIRKPTLEVLDTDARIFLFRGFLTDAEVAHLIKTAEPRLDRSGVVNTESGHNEVDNIRTSYSMFFSRGEDAVVREVEERISRWTLMPVGSGEGLQVLRYGPGQKYDQHFDFFLHKGATANGGNRYATVLMYLSDVEEGGETVFPAIPAPPGRKEEVWSECAQGKLAVKPRKGDALLFHSIKPNGELERRSMHGACPVIKGTKWAMTKWLHAGHYADGNEVPQDIPQHTVSDGSPEGCRDTSGNCAFWANGGECLRNPAFMIGTRSEPGTCIKSCDSCHVLLDM